MSTLKCTTLSKQDGSASVPVDTVVNGSAKAWVNFNGTGTVAIRASFNVSSITDNGTGDYSVNFSAAFADANYAAAISNGHYNAFTGTSVLHRGNDGAQDQSASAIRILAGYVTETTAAIEDRAAMFVAIFR